MERKREREGVKSGREREEEGREKMYEGISVLGDSENQHKDSEFYQMYDLV